MCSCSKMSNFGHMFKILAARRIYLDVKNSDVTSICFVCLRCLSIAHFFARGFNGFCGEPKLLECDFEYIVGDQHDLPRRLTFVGDPRDMRSRVMTADNKTN